MNDLRQLFAAAAAAHADLRQAVAQLREACTRLAAAPEKPHTTGKEQDR